MEQKEQPTSDNDKEQMPTSNETERHLSQETPRKSKRTALIVLAVLLAVILGLGGWLVSQKNNDDDEQAKSTLTEEVEQKQEQKEEQRDPSEAGKYLVIEEWGVRFPLPEELRGDVEYGVFTESSGEQSVHFIINEIDQLPGSNCGLEERAGYQGGSGILGGVVDLHRKRTRYPTETSVRYDAEISLGEYWYYVGSMRDACFSAPDDQFARLVKEIESLADAAGKLELVRQ